MAHVRDPIIDLRLRNDHLQSNGQRSVSQRLLGPWSTLTSWLVVAIAVLHPPTGLGVPLCISRFHTSIPCPGCGLSRSVSCFARGMFLESALLHPFGAVIIIWALVVACLSLSPTSIRTRVVSVLQARHRSVMIIYVALVVGFIGFGMLRVLTQVIEFLIKIPSH